MREESSNSSDDSNEEEGSEIETPSEDESNLAVEDRQKCSKSKVGNGWNLIGPSYSNIPIRYHGKVSYQSYVREVLERLGGGVAGGVAFPDWMPSSSDWVEIPQRSVGSIIILHFMIF